MHVKFCHAIINVSVTVASKILLRFPTASRLQPGESLKREDAVP